VASNNIGTSRLILSADGTQLKSGLAQASQDINHFAKQTKGQLNASIGQSAAASMPQGGGLFKSVIGMAKSAFTAAGGVAGGALGSAIGSVIPGVGTMIGGTIGSAVGGALSSTVGEGLHGALETVIAPLERIKELGKINKRASALGIEPSELQGISLLLKKAGMDADQSSHLFTVMGKNLAHQLDANGDKQTAFKNLKIDPKQLAGQSITEQFKTIADGISKLPKGMQQTQSAMAIFGKSAGADLLSQLQKGSVGIDKFIEEAKRSGAVLSNEDLQQAGRAAKAWKEAKEKIEQLWEGLYNRLSVIVAPFVEFIGDKLSKVGEFLLPIFAKVSRAATRIGAIGFAAFELLSQGVDYVITYVGGLIDSFDLFGGNTKSIEQVVTSVLKNIAIGFGYVWDTVKWGVGNTAQGLGTVMTVVGVFATRFKETIRSMSDNIINSVTGILQLAADANREFNPINGEKVARGYEAWNSKIQGNRDKINNAMGSVGEVLTTNGNAWQQWGKEQKDAWGNSDKAIESWFGTLDFSQKKARAELQKTQNQMKQVMETKYQKLDFAVKGSQADLSIMNSFRHGNEQKSMEKNLASMVKKQQENNEVMKEIKGLFQNMDFLKVA
jgi:hypothetical protein